MTGIEIKQFISSTLGIPKNKLRASAGKNFSEVCIVCEKRLPTEDRNSMKYLYRFTEEFGNRCMRIIYKGHPSLEAQNYGGNVTSVSIAMSPAQWQELREQYAQQAVLDQMSDYQMSESDLKLSINEEYAEEIAAGQHSEFDK